MDCQSCRNIEVVVGGDHVIYFCHAFKVFVSRSKLFFFGRFCISYKERRENDNEND